jgi:hypothetical protein
MLRTPYATADVARSLLTLQGIRLTNESSSRQARFACARREVMYMKSVKWEEALPDEKERLLVEAQSLLVGVEEVHLRDLEATVKDVRRDVSKAYELVHRLEGLLKAGKRKK